METVGNQGFFQRRNRRRRTLMNWDTVKGNWKQMTGKVKQEWGELTD